MKLSIELNETAAEDLTRLAEQCSIAHQISLMTTHGELTVTGLLEMLAEDAAMVISRPGCWEAANLAAVLASHGYEI